MKDLEKALEGGRNLPTPPELGTKLKDAVDHAVGATSVAAGAATASSLTAWVAGGLTIAIATALTLFLWERDTPAVDVTAGAGEVAEIASEKPAASTADTQDTLNSTATAAVDDSSSVVTTTTDHTPQIHGLITNLNGLPIADGRVIVKLVDAGAHEPLVTIEILSDADGHYRCTQEQIFSEALRVLDEKQKAATAGQEAADAAKDAAALTAALEHESGALAITYEAAQNGSFFTFMTPTDHETLKGRLELALKLAQTKSVVHETTVQHPGDNETTELTEEVVDADTATADAFPSSDVRANRESLMAAEFTYAEQAREEAAKAEATVALDLAQAEQRSWRAAALPGREPRVVRQLPAPATGVGADELTALRAQYMVLQEQQAMLISDTNMATRWMSASGFRITLSALVDGYQGATEVQQAVTGSETIHRDFALAPGHTMRGLVLDAARRPIAGATVEIVASPGADVLPEDARITTADHDGSFYFSSLGAATNVLHATAPGWQTTQRVARAGTKAVVIEMTRGATIEVTLTMPSGAPAAGYEVELLRAGERYTDARTDEAGNVAFTALPGGDYTLVGYDRSPFPLFEETLSVWAGEVVRQQLRLSSDVDGVAGQLVFTTPAEERPQLSVVAYYLNASPHSQRKLVARVNAEGRFEMGRLPAGAYVFGIASLRGSSWGHRCFRDVTLRPGNGPQVVTLAYEEVADATLRVTVEDSAGQPIVGADVEMTRARTRLSATRQTNKNGSYELKLHPDHFKVEVRAPGYDTANASFELVSGATRSVAVTLTEQPDTQAALQALLGDEPVATAGRLTVQSVFDLVQLHAPGVLIVAPALVPAKQLAEKHVDSHGQSTLASLLANAIDQHDISWSADAATIFVGPQGD